MERNSSTKLCKYYEGVGIFHQKSVPRTPQQNGVVKRRNHTLVEAARIMLIFSKAPLFLWAEVVATACSQGLYSPPPCAKHLLVYRCTCAEVGFSNMQKHIANQEGFYPRDIPIVSTEAPLGMIKRVNVRNNEHLSETKIFTMKMGISCRDYILHAPLSSAVSAEWRGVECVVGREDVGLWGLGVSVVGVCGGGGWGGGGSGWVGMGRSEVWAWRSVVFFGGWVGMGLGVDVVVLEGEWVSGGWGGRWVGGRRGRVCVGMSVELVSMVGGKGGVLRVGGRGAVVGAGGVREWSAWLDVGRCSGGVWWCGGVVLCGGEWGLECGCCVEGEGAVGVLAWVVWWSGWWLWGWGGGEVGSAGWVMGLGGVWLDGVRVVGKCGGWRCGGRVVGAEWCGGFGGSAWGCGGGAVGGEGVVVVKVLVVDVEGVVGGLWVGGLGGGGEWWWAWGVVGVVGPVVVGGGGLGGNGGMGGCWFWVGVDARWGGWVVAVGCVVCEGGGVGRLEGWWREAWEDGDLV
ncbi:retrovirus-related pol polyprotein from transposon TNT 1-94 [Tanacetum coccineum]